MSKLQVLYQVIDQRSMLYYELGFGKTTSLNMNSCINVNDVSGIPRRELTTNYNGGAVQKPIGLGLNL